MAIYEVILETPDGKHHLSCPDDLYILDVAEEAGISLPYSCRAGSCGSCMAKLIQGTVNQPDASFLDDDQKNEGFVLLCSTYPTSACTLITHQEGHEGMSWATPPKRWEDLKINDRLGKLPSNTVKNINKGVGLTKVAEALNNPEHFEILIADGKLMSAGGQFGHVGLEIDGVVFGMSTNGWDTRDKRSFLQGYTKASRDIYGFELSLSHEQKLSVVNALLTDLNTSKGYDFIGYNCATAITNVFDKSGISVIDNNFMNYTLKSPMHMKMFLEKNVPKDDWTLYKGVKTK